MECFVCSEDYFRHPTGLGGYRSMPDIGVIEEEVRRMSAPPRKPKLKLKKEVPEARTYYCPSCFISVKVIGKDATNTR